MEKGWAFHHSALVSSLPCPAARIWYRLAHAWNKSQSPEAGAHTAAQKVTHVRLQREEGIIRNCLQGTAPPLDLF